ncbi:hypothetical protein SUGI_0445540 [Cryptomeria japonica]|nr:hypothetical protein SUGI_0445540 [Cryptomeria japonica]
MLLQLQVDQYSRSHVSSKFFSSLRSFKTKSTSLSLTKTPFTAPERLALRNGALQLMYAELQVLSPLVPTREIYFARFCKQHDDGLLGVVDVSVDCLLNNPHASLVKCRKRPSGCLLRDMPNGRSKVIWVEHAEHDNIGVHRIFRSVVNSGMAFGAQRWLATLQRQCERIAFLAATNTPIPARDITAAAGA